MSRPRVHGAAAGVSTPVQAHRSSSPSVPVEQIGEAHGVVTGRTKARPGSSVYCQRNSVAARVLDCKAPDVHGPLTWMQRRCDPTARDPGSGRLASPARRIMRSVKLSLTNHVEFGRTLDSNVLSFSQVSLSLNPGPLAVGFPACSRVAAPPTKALKSAVNKPCRCSGPERAESHRP